MTEVILVDDNDKQVGVMEKMEAHQKGLLHRAFSIFIFNDKGELLLHQRAKDKYHSPGLWTNTCCSHPLPGENSNDAAKRRLKEEMGFATPLEKIFDFTYKATFNNGLTEHEFDHVYIGEWSGKIDPDKKEVADYSYKTIADIKSDIESNPDNYTVWFKIALPKIEEYLVKTVG